MLRGLFWFPGSKLLYKKQLKLYVTGVPDKVFNKYSLTLPSKNEKYITTTWTGSTNKRDLEPIVELPPHQKTVRDIITSLLCLLSNLNSLYRLSTSIKIEISTILIRIGTLSTPSFSISTSLSSTSTLSSIGTSVLLSIFIRKTPILNLDISMLSSLYTDSILLSSASISF